MRRPSKPLDTLLRGVLAIAFALGIISVAQAQRELTSPDLSAFTTPTLGPVSIDPRSGWIYASGFQSRAMGLVRNGFARVTHDGVIDAAWVAPRMHATFGHVLAEDGSLFVHGMLSASGPRVIARFETTSPAPTDVFQMPVGDPPMVYDGIGNMIGIDGARYVYFSVVQTGQSINRTIRRIDTRTRRIDATWSHRQARDYPGVIVSRDSANVVVTQTNSQSPYDSTSVTLVDGVTGAIRWIRQFDRAYLGAAASDSRNRTYLLLRSNEGRSGASIVRLDEDGTVDASWNGVPASQAASLSPWNSRILLHRDTLILNVAEGPSGDQLTRVGLRSYAGDGHELARWSVPGSSAVTTLQPDRDGNLVGAVAGKLQVFDGTTLQPLRSLALSFGAMGSVGQVVKEVDGSRLFAGSFDAWYDGQRFRSLLRTRADGSPDHDWRFEFDEAYPTLHLIPTSRGMLLSGSFKRINGLPRAGLALLKSDGQVDLEWNWSPPPLAFGLRYDPSGDYLYFIEYLVGYPGSRLRRLSMRDQRVDPDWEISIPSLPGFSGDGVAHIDPAGGVWVTTHPESTFGGQPAFSIAVRRYDIASGAMTLSEQPVVGAYYGANISATAEHIYIAERRYSFRDGGRPDPNWRADAGKYHYLGQQRVVGNYLYFSSYVDGGTVFRSPTSGNGAVDPSWVTRNADFAGCVGSEAAVMVQMPPSSGDVGEFLLRCPEFNRDPSAPFRPGSAHLITSESTASERVEVVEYFNSDVRRYVLTGRANEKRELDALPTSFQRTGMRFSARDSTYRNPPENAICRFYAPPDRGGSNTHFYGANDDCATLNTVRSMHFEGYDFSILRPTAGQCAGTAPIAVTRLYNNKAATNESNHRYVVSEATKARMLAQGWVDEGPVFCATAATDAAN